MWPESDWSITVGWSTAPQRIWRTGAFVPHAASAVKTVAEASSAHTAEFFQVSGRFSPSVGNEFVDYVDVGVLQVGPDLIS